MSDAVSDSNLHWSLYWRQFNALIWKNWLFSLRRWKLSLVQILSPILFISVLLAIDSLPKSSMDNPYNPLPRILKQPIIPFGNVAKCVPWNSNACVTLAYAPSDLASADTKSSVDELMSFISIEANLLPQDLKRFNNESEFVNFCKHNPNQTTNALIFNTISGNLFDYLVYFNASSDLLSLIVPSRKPDNRNELQIAVDTAILKYYSFKSASPRSLNYSITYSSRRYPQLGYKGGQSAVEENGVAFFYCGIMFQFVIFLYNICHEKDLKLRQGLTIIGMSDSAYWASWILFGMIYNVIATAVLISFGYLLNIDFFTRTDVSVNFLMFTLFGLSTCALAMFCSLFIGKAKGSLNAGILLFVLGLLLVGIVSGNAKSALYDYYNVYSFIPELLSFLFPMYNLGSAMAEIKSKLKDKAAHFSWSDVSVNRYLNHTINYSETVQINIPNAGDSFLRLFMNACVFFVVAGYLDQVLPSPNGEPKHVFYFLKPLTSYFRLKSNSSTSPETITSRTNLLSLDQDSEDDIDVSRERQNLMKQMDGIGKQSLLQIRNISKEFRINKNGKFVKFKALDNLWLSCESDEILVLLGHNGAGKSTLINILIGLTKPSDGNAIISHESVRDNMASIRRIIGVCPQHDVLWDELTANEHLQLISEIKGTPKNEIKGMIEKLLSDVQLTKDAKNSVGTFSGGMKRRLSVAISFTGNPKLVFLDEPTSGMDPLVRRDIWNLILRMKKERCLLMTTHSMDEADTLGDKIAVISAGILKTVGTSIKLKNRWSGYCLTASIPRSQKENFKELLMKFLDSRPDDSEDRSNYNLSGYIYCKYHVAPNSDSDIVNMLQYLESNSEYGWIKELNFSQASLEDVFIKVTSEQE